MQTETQEKRKLRLPFWLGEARSLQTCRDSFKVLNILTGGNTQIFFEGGVVLGRSAITSVIKHSQKAAGDLYIVHIY